jgi:cation:H+ antiporter
MSQPVKDAPLYWVRLFAPFVLCLGLAMPALLTYFLALETSPVLAAVYFGIAIVAAAFMLGWVGEAAELDMSGGLSVGLLAIVAILPEYVVSVYFAFAAGTDPSMAAYASANLTGANRLLLGFGWPAVALLGFLALRATRKKKGREKEPYGVVVDPEARTDLGFLVIASILALVVPLTGELHLVVGVLFVAIFVAYLWRQSHADREEPELEGTAAFVGALPKWGRRAFVASVVAIAAAIILVSAEPFAHNLVEAGKSLGVDDYLLVQWLAPLASEAPEFTLALVFAARGKAAAGLAILISSKVNQWTALTGSLPIAYVVGGGTGAALPLVDARQIEEFTLTSAQTVLGVALLIGLRFGFRASALLFTMFAITFVFPQTEVRIWLAYIYFAIAAVILIRQRRFILPTLKAPFQIPRKQV